MNAGARQNYLAVGEQGTKKARSNGERTMKMETEARVEARIAERTGHACREARTGGKPRVFVAAENRLLREALSRMLVKGGDIEVADILLLTSRGSMNEDLTAIRTVRAGRSPRVSSEGGIRGRGCGGGTSGASRRGGLPRHAVRAAISLFRTGGDVLSFCERTAAHGSDAAGTTVDSADRRRAHE